MTLTCCRCHAGDRRLYVGHLGKVYCSGCLPVEGLGLVDRSHVMILRSRDLREHWRSVRRRKE